MTANSPFYEGRLAGRKSQRGDVWLRMDPERSGLIAPLWREGQAVWQTAAVGLVATVAMAGVMAVITGYALMRLTDQPNVSRGRSRYRARSTDPG